MTPNTVERAGPAQPPADDRFLAVVLVTMLAEVALFLLAMASATWLP